MPNLSAAVSFAKKQWLAGIFAIALIVLILRQNQFYPLVSPMMAPSATTESLGMASKEIGDYVSAGYPGRGVYPSTSDSVNLNAQDRKTVTNASLSLLVSDVRQTLDQVTQAAKAAGGFVVNSSLYQPTEASSGYMSIRVPSAQLDQVLASLRQLSVKVLSEDLNSTDVTDQYTDYQARLTTLESTKLKFEAILAEARDVDEILRVQQSIISIQEQIDGVKGQIEYLKNTSQSSLISISLSTDELSLPYAPDNAWRPGVIFKQAVRSLVLNVRGLGELAIWGLVYAPVVLVAGAVIYVAMKVLVKRI